MRIYENKKRIQEIYDGVLMKRNEPVKFSELKEEVLKLFEETGSKLAEGLYHYMSCNEILNHYKRKESFFHATTLMKIGEELDNPLFIAAAHNYLGSYYRTGGNILTAYDHFWNGIQFLKERAQEFPEAFSARMQWVLSSNITTCLMDVKEYDLALEQMEEKAEWFRASETAIKKTPDFLAFIFSLSLLYYDSGKYDKMEGAIAWFLEEWNKLGEREKKNDWNIWILQYLCAYTNGHTKRAQEILDQASGEKLKESANRMIAIGQFQEQLLQAKQYEKFLELQDILYHSIMENEDIGEQVCYWELQGRYYQAIGDWEAQKRAMAEYGRLNILLNEQLLDERANSLRTYIQVKQKGEEMEETRELLLHKSEYDELTNLPNRYKLAEFCREAFARAAQEKITISVEIIDVDFFKQVNDHYGHLQGDACLRGIAGELQKTLGDLGNQIAARYGGDEFIVIRIGMTDEEIGQEMQELKQAVVRLAFPNEYSTAADVVTISQGAVNKVAEEWDNLESFLKIADEGLYEAKKISKNTVVLLSGDRT